AALEEQPRREHLEEQFRRWSHADAVVDETQQRGNERARHPPRSRMRKAHTETPVREVRAEDRSGRDRDAAQKRRGLDVELARFGVVQETGGPGEPRENRR